MIIKRKNAAQHASLYQEPLPEQGRDAMPSGEPLPPEEAPTVWTAETIETGQAPERRDPERHTERRRGYRRVEDRDLISKAYEEAVAIKENAHNQGFEEGLQQAQYALDELKETLNQLMNGREEALLSVADEIGSLAVEVAARIIKTEVSCDETLVMGLVRDTIQKAGRNTKSILLKVNPEDSPTIKKTVKEDPLTSQDTELIIMDDPAVDQGSCVIETSSGLIDASFSTQLGILRQLFGSKADL